MEKILVITVCDEKGETRFTHYAKPEVSDFIGETKAYKVPASLMPRLTALACDGKIWKGMETLDSLYCYGNDINSYKFEPDNVFTGENPFFNEEGASGESWDINIKLVDLYC